MNNMHGRVYNNFSLYQSATFDAMAQVFRELELLRLLANPSQGSTTTYPIEPVATNLARAHTNTKIQTQIPIAPANNIGATDAPRLSPQYASLALMWDEWQGTGGPATKDKPIPGGFAELEKTQKNKWRRHLGGSQGQILKEFA